MKLTVCHQQFLPATNSYCYPRITSHRPCDLHHNAAYTGESPADHKQPPQHHTAGTLCLVPNSLPKTSCFQHKWKQIGSGGTHALIIYFSTPKDSKQKLTWAAGTRALRRLLPCSPARNSDSSVTAQLLYYCTAVYYTAVHCCTL